MPPLSALLLLLLHAACVIASSLEEPYMEDANPNLRPYYQDTIDFSSDPIMDENKRNGYPGRNFVRFGRADVSNNNFDYDTPLASKQSRSEPMMLTNNNDRFVRFGRGRSDFLRFGRGEKSSSNFLRFGRNGPHHNNNHIQHDEYNRNKREADKRINDYDRRNDNFMRFGRTPHHFIPQTNEAKYNGKFYEQNNIKKQPLFRLLTSLMRVQHEATKRFAESA